MKNIITSFFLLACVTLFAQVPPPPPASQAEVNAGVDTYKYVSPATLAGATSGGVTLGQVTNIVTGMVSPGPTNTAIVGAFLSPADTTGTNNVWTKNASGLTNIPVSNVIINTNDAPLTNTIVGFFWLTNGSATFKVPVLQ